MPSAAITITILVILGLAIGVPSIEWWSTSKDLAVCKADAATFSAGVEAKGLQSKLDKERTENSLRQAAVNIQGALNEKQTELDRVYADNERLRLAAKAGPRGGPNASLADAASAIECPDARAGFAERLEQLDRGVRATLLKSRDEAIVTLNACKTYVNKVTETVNKNQEPAP